MEFSVDRDSYSNDVIPDPENVDPRIRKDLNNSMKKPDEVPVFKVTNLVKDMPGHIPKGAFARMIIFKEDLDKQREAMSQSARGKELTESDNDFFKKSPMLMQQGRRYTQNAEKRQAVREKMLTKMS